MNPFIRYPLVKGIPGAVTGGLISYMLPENMEDEFIRRIGIDKNNRLRKVLLGSLIGGGIGGYSGLSKVLTRKMNHILPK